MILVLAIYFGMAYYLVEKLFGTAKRFEDEYQILNSKPDEDDLNEYLDDYNLDINIDTNNILYKEFISVVNKNELDKNKKILIGCTGDYQSIALLTIALKVFNKENIHVFFYKYSYNNILYNFLSILCSENDVQFNSVEADSLDDNKVNRYKYINDLCKENNISYVFEAHNLINHSNQILANIFDKPEEEPVLNNLYKPFINIDNITLLKFFSTHDIIIDKQFTHLEHTQLQNKTIFDKIESDITDYYPNWRVSVIEHFNNIDFTQELNVFRGKYGFKILNDFNTISYIIFKKSINKLFEEYSFTSDFMYEDLNDYYMEDEEQNFISSEYQHKIDNFTDYLDNTDLNELIEELQENASEISFEDLEESMNENKDIKEDTNDNDNNETNETFEESNEESNDNDSNFSVSENNDIEYIVRVDLTNAVPFMTLVKKIENYAEDYLNGIIYVNICNNLYYVYDSNTNG